MKKHYFLANTFNASLLCLQKHDLVEIEREIKREFILSTVKNIQEISLLAHQVRNTLELLQKGRKYLSFRKDRKPRVTCLPQTIIEKKQLKQYLLLQT
jgi:hypothetical protein